MTQETAATKLAVSQSYVANKLRLLKLSAEESELILEEGLTERHARALLRLNEEAEKRKVIDLIAQTGMSVARTERYIEDLLSANPDKLCKPSIGAFLKNVNTTLARIQQSGIRAVSERTETDSQIVLTITIPK